MFPTPTTYRVVTPSRCLSTGATRLGVQLLRQDLDLGGGGGLPQCGPELLRQFAVFLGPLAVRAGAGSALPSAGHPLTAGRTPSVPARRPSWWRHRQARIASPGAAQPGSRRNC